MYSNLKFLQSTDYHLSEFVNPNRFLIRPITAYIDVTNKCHQNCVWCMFKERRGEETISLEEITNVIKQVKELGCKSVIFSGGGEPLYNQKTFPNAFDMVKKSGMKCALKTNGVFLGSYLQAISRSCTFVKVSLDASCDKTYMELHRSGSWNIVLNNISKLREIYKGELSVDFLVHPKNYREVHEFLVLADYLGVSHAGIKPVLVEGFRLTDDIIDSVNRQIDSYAEVGSTPVYSRIGRASEVRCFNKCFSTPLTLTIGADMKVYTCCRKRGLEDHVIGDLRKETLDEIWMGKKRREVVNNIDVSECLPWWCWTSNAIFESLTNVKHAEFL